MYGQLLEANNFSVSLKTSVALSVIYVQGLTYTANAIIMR